MERTIRRLRTGVLSAAVAGALGFGAAQALASPQDAPQQVCNDRLCARLCTTLGFPGGFCAGDSCVCYLGE